MNYPFSTGDLLCAGQTASSYLDNNTKVPVPGRRCAYISPDGHNVSGVCTQSAETSTSLQRCCAHRLAMLMLQVLLQVPWEDLRYLFGEILYGGHIVEDWDRRLSSAYLNKHFTEALLEGPELFPGFTPAPGNANHKMVRLCSSTCSCKACCADLW